MLARKKLLGEYKIGRTIGEGAFSKVKLATHKVTGQKVAIKVMKKEDLENEKKEERAKAEKEAKRNPYLAEQMRAAQVTSTAQHRTILDKLSKEVKLLMRLDHQNIIKLHQVIETDTEMYIIMEYASGGELIDYIAAKGHLSEKEGRRLFRELISTIDHCHLAGVVHRDLKLENLLLSADKSLRLSDFGLGRTVRTTDQYLNTFCGTPLYAGPELVSGIKYIGPAADVWSMGVVLFIMMAGRPPFKCDTIAELYQQIKSVKYTCPEHFSPELKALLEKMLVRNPATRATIDELRADAWVLKDDPAPPLRIIPKVMVAERKPGSLIDDELDDLVGAIDKYDGFTVYNFHKQDDAVVVNEELLESTASNGSPTSMNDPAAAAQGHPQSAQPQGRNRRSSLAVAIGKLSIFGGGKRDASATPQQPHSATVTPASPSGNKVTGGRARTMSISPTNNVHPTFPASAPVSPTSPQPKVTLTGSGNSDLLTPLAPTHLRRHSVAVGVPMTNPGSMRQPSPPSGLVENALARPLAVAGASGPQRGSANVTPTITVIPENMLAQQRVNAASAPFTQSHKNGNRSMATGSTMNHISETEEDSMTTITGAHFPPPPSKDRHSHGAANALDSLAVQTPVDRRQSIAPGGGENTYGLVSSPGAYSEEIRSVRFGFGVHAASAAVKSPEEIVKQFEAVLGNDFLFPRDVYGDDGISCHPRGKWVYICSYDFAGSNTKVVFEVEVVKIWLLKMYGLKLKRLGGDALSYKTTYDRILESLKW